MDMDYVAFNSCVVYMYTKHNISLPVAINGGLPPLTSYWGGRGYTLTYDVFTIHPSGHLMS